MKKGTILYGAACFMLGAAICGGGAAYAAGVMAERSTNAFYVDGEQVELPAYVINGSNYVMLRDVGQVVGFNVYWDEEDRTVQIESDKPYTGVAPAKASSLANGQPVTEENVLTLLRQIEKDWPTGTVWGTMSTPGTCKNSIPCKEAGEVMDRYRVSKTYGCSGYAAMVSTLLFGDEGNPVRRVEDLSQIRPGDILIFVRNDSGKVWHVTVALESPNAKNALHYTDGNNGEVVYWPSGQSPYSRECLDCYGENGKTYRIEAWTRYPEDVPFTGESAEAWG